MKRDAEFGYQTGPNCKWAAVVLFSSALWASSQTLDGFNPGADGPVYAMAIQPDGKILVGGDFLNLAGHPRSHIGRINADGTLDATFDPGADDAVYCLAVTEDSSILVGGRFKALAGNPRDHFARLSANGVLDMNFNPGANSNVVCIALDPGGRILIGGAFSTVAGQPRRGIARLYANGSLDTAFGGEVGYAVPGDYFLTIALESDGSILVGGAFDSVNGQPKYAIAKMNSDGTLDTNFQASVTWFVASLSVRSDGQIVLAGGFDKLNREPRPSIGCLNPDGTLARSFDPEPAFRPYDSAFATLNLQANSKALAGELIDGYGLAISNPPPFIYKYDSQGTLETNSSVAASTEVHCLALQQDGKILAGGFFTTMAGQTRNRIGRLTNSDDATHSLNSDISGITWLRGGSSPDAWRTSFSWSTNGTEWIYLGAGTHISGGWRISLVMVPTNATIRARGFVTGGYCNGSTWFVEEFLGPQTQPIIVNDGTVGFQSNSFRFQILASIGRVVEVEGSSDLTHWTPLATNVMASGPFEFADTEAANFRSRFYRVRLQ